MANSAHNLGTFTWNNAGVGQWLATTAGILAMIEDGTRRLTEEVKDDIKANHYSSKTPSKQMFHIERTAGYFANNVRSRIIRTTGHQAGIPIGVIALKASNAMAYEAEHKNLQRVVARQNGV